MEPFTFGNINTRIFDEDETAAAVEYWTDERMANAKPLRRVLTLEEHEEAIKRGMAEEPTPTTTAIEPSPPLSGLPGVPHEADVEAEPYMVAGKFYFTKPDGVDFVASAQIVGNSHTLMTAAHCVVGADKFNGKYFTKLLFKRAWDKNNPGLSQSIGITQVCVDTRYYSSGTANNSFDYAFLALEEKADSIYTFMRYYPGHPTFDVTAIGYPENYGNSDFMYAVTGTAIANYESNIVEMSDNPMGEGCSGGAWFTCIESVYYAVGLNSYGSDLHPNRQYSPLFTNDTSDLLNYAMQIALPVQFGDNVQLVSTPSGKYIAKEVEGAAEAPVNKAYYPTLSTSTPETLNVVSANEESGEGTPIQYSDIIWISTTNEDVNEYKWLSRYREAADCFYFTSQTTIPKAMQWQGEC